MDEITEVAASTELPNSTEAAAEPEHPVQAVLGEIESAVDHPAVSFLNEIETELMSIGGEVEDAVKALIAKIKAVL